MRLFFLKNFFIQKKIPAKTLFLFTNQLATLLQAGMPLLPSLLMLEEQETQRRFKKIITHLIASLHEGKSFSDALSDYPTLFFSDYRGMIKAGEQGGILGEALHQIALLQEKRHRLQQQLVAILLYPSIVLITALVIIGLLFFFVVPKFETIFSEMFSEKTLPLLTQIILKLSHTIVNHPNILLFGGVVLLGGISFFSNTKQGRLWRDQIFLRTPYLKNFFKKNILARFTRTVGTLLAHGVSLLPALELGKETTGSHSVDELFQEVHDSIERGNAIVTSLRQRAFFPPTFVNMIEVGEATGQLPKVFLNLADFYENEIETITKRFLAVLEPLIILSLALFLGTIIVALFLPLVTIMSEMGN